MKKILSVFAAAYAALTLPAQPLAANIDIEAPIHSLSEPITTAEFTEFFGRYKEICLTVSGVCTLIGLVSFIRAATKLSTSAGNDRARTEAIKGLLVSGASLALFGGISTIVGVFWNFL